ncbi:hypothetical protein EW026_g7475 [Hermanssonia centrifuga]|uniref:NACHT domain-containing protein n=1 Tax=Hermanssonia centrifuga TaxID=98765 RepID=A0A4S4K7P9_9APHY|nr:hypothetical protein EW026_g7475 [Hermanssonia centrifuga]
MDGVGTTSRDGTILKLDILQVKVLGQEHLPREIEGKAFNKRRFYVEFKIGGMKKKTKHCSGNGRLEWNLNKAVSFTNVDSSSIFEAAIYAKRALSIVHDAVKIDGLSDSVESILPPSYSQDTSCVVIRVLDSYAEVQLELHIKVTTAASLGADTEAAIRNAAKPVQDLRGSHSPQIPTDVASAAAGTAQTVGKLLLPVLDRIKPFCEAMDSISELHPYAKIAWSIVKGVYTILNNQLKRNDKIGELFAKMDSFYSIVGKDLMSRLGGGGSSSLIAILQRISVMTMECCSFIQLYISNLNASGFVAGALKNSVSSNNDRIETYCNIFDSLQQDFCDAIRVDTHHIVERMAEYASLGDMPHVKGASLNAEGSCLEGTRKDILGVVSKWISKSLGRQPILLLTGEAGTGKSAIACSVAVEFAALGCSFGFKRGIAERCNSLNLFPTIARDLAHFDDSFRRALCAGVGNDKALQTTSSLEVQFQHFIKNPMAGISRPILVVIDALDECGDAKNRAQRVALLRLLATPGKLPPNLRFFITSRPESDICSHFEDPNEHYIITMRMNKIPIESTSEDITLYIRTRLITDFHSKLEGIDEACCQPLAHASQGLFQWAFVACDQIAYPPTGRKPREQYKRLVQSSSDVGQDKLLDGLYLEVLRPLFAEDNEEGTIRFKSVLAVVLASFEPLTMTGIKAMHEALKPSDDDYDAGDILQHLGSLLSGVNDRDVPIRPLHISFRDFLTDEKRSHGFFVDEAGAQHSLGLASLRTMIKMLRFNICKLESSYMLNDEIPDLQKRIDENIPSHLSYSCRFWARHLDIASTNGRIGNPDVRRLLKAFVDESILFWLEVLSILGGVSPASPALETTAQGVIQHSDVIRDIAISTDGARIAGACGESGVFIWDTRTGLLNSSLSKCGGYALRIAFSADGARVAYALLRGTIGVWDVESGRNWTIAEFIFGLDSDEVVCLTFSPDGRKLIAGSNHGTVGIWDTSSGDASGAILYQSIMKCSFDCISFLSHGGALACGYKENTIEVWKWDATTLQLTEQPLHIEAESSVFAVGVSFDGRHVAASLENDTICLWGLPEGTPIGISVSMSSRTDWEVRKIVFTQDGSRFASAGHRGAVDVWKITPTGPVLEVSLQGHTDWVWGLAYSPYGRHLFSCSDDRTIRKWDAHSTNTPDPTIPQSTSSIVGVHISHDGTRIASVSEDGTVCLWDGASGTVIPSRLPTIVNEGTIYLSAMSRDGTRIMAFSRGMVWLLDFKGCKQTERRIELDTEYDSTGVFSADGSRIYITSGDRKVNIIDVDTMEETLDSSTGEAFPLKEFYGPPVISPDGAQFAVLSQDTDETVRLRTLDSQTVEEVSLPMLLHSSDQLWRWCISPDLHYVACELSHKDNIQVMRIEDGILQKAISLHFDDTSCFCLVFLPYTTATLLASAHGSDIVIWDLVSCNPIIGPLRHSNSTAGVTSMACSQDGMRLVAGYEDGKVLVWDVSVFGDSHSGNSVIPIVLSPEAAHALPHPEDILSPEVAAPKVYSKGNPINTVEMTRDGWIVGPEYRRLFWVPPELRAGIWPHRMKWDITGGEERIQFDLSQVAHGRRWTDCYVDSDLP